MNKTAIKNYAIWARVQLIESSKQKAFEYEITDGGENITGLDAIGGRLLTKAEKEQRNQLISEINRKGYVQVMEEAAYTWFNRFIALRFMEVNGYLPSMVRVFTDENGAFKPEILKQAMSVEMEGLDRAKVLDLLDKQDNEELYKYLIITQCNALNNGLPHMFEKIANWTELLFPANLLRQDSVIGQMISGIPEEDWTDAVQIIGWLYQYYNSELKDETFALLKKNVKITKERIPAATQLFTPDWIVRYMVENSLGRLWYEGHNYFDKSLWKYYLDEAEQKPEVVAQLQKIHADYTKIKPEEIKVIDPCMGSGHILVYAFDVLMQIYTSVGWAERDAAKSILENNLYGLDIDDRAGQLAYFAVMMKARKYSRRILNGEVKPNVISIQDSNWMTDEFIAYFSGKDEDMKADMIMLRKTFLDAKEYGSILCVPTMQYDALYERIDSISSSYAEDLFQTQFHTMATEYLLPLVKQSQIMSLKYDITITNPPYMGSSGMGEKLSDYIAKEYPCSKNDLFSCFMERAYKLTKSIGMTALITMESWMFLTSFERLRTFINSNKTIVNMVHMPYLGKGGTSLGINFGTSAVVMLNCRLRNYNAQYEYTVYYETDYDGIPYEFPTMNSRWKAASQDDFKRIPGGPIAYWVGEHFYSLFTNYPSIGSIARARSGAKTGNNDLFLKCWWEINHDDFTSTIKSSKECRESRKKWFPHNKGGDFKNWYGNRFLVVNFMNSGEEIKKNGERTGSSYDIAAQDVYFHEGITWTALTSSKNSFRFSPAGCVFDTNKGPMCFPMDRKTEMYLLALLVSPVSNTIFDILNPSLSLQNGDFDKLPYVYSEQYSNTIVEYAELNVKMAKEDYDSFESSWDFKKHPLI